MNLTDISKENQFADPKSYKIPSSRSALKSLNLSAFLNVSQIPAEIQNPDPQLVSEYAVEISNNLKIQENSYQISHEYMKLQPDINLKHRAVLIDWIISAHKHFKLLTETLFLTVYLIDRYLEKRAVTRQQLQLVGVTALFVSAKYEEIYPPEVKDFVNITDRAYTKDQVVKMEREMLTTLEFNITFPSAWRFFERFSLITSLNPQGQSVGQYVLELALVEYHMLKYKASLKAASAAYLGHKIFNRDYVWSTEGFSEAEIKECAKDLLILFQAASKHPLSAVREKFSRPQYHDVSNLRLS
ncbi:unnamed protein product [Blepharisma stoltei]|uniref:Cyclin N-terminal domain-containing protein n=1 Tax=Blepharisma stoltei TaxID=1481888 RepID=A0AAU9K4D8_9CILI|nr:unnamed protein product [Blepharisma stoltei]